MTSTFNPLVPTGLVNLSTDYKNLQNNFQQLDTSFGKNHVKFSVTANNGKHTFIQMPTLGSEPSLPPGLTSGDGTVFTNTTGEVNLFYTQGAAGNIYQMTRTSDASFASFATENPGWTFLPGGLLLQYGFAATVGTGVPNSTFNFPRQFTTGVYSATATILSGSINPYIVKIVSLSTTQFNAVVFNPLNPPFSQAGITYYWTVIGN